MLIIGPSSTRNRREAPMELPTSPTRPQGIMWGTGSNNLRIGQFNHHLVRRGFTESAAHCLTVTKGPRRVPVAGVIF